MAVNAKAAAFFRTYGLESGIIAAAIIAAAALFCYALSVPYDYRVSGDAFIYMRTGLHFSSFGDGLSYTGERTFGYPLFLYVIKAVLAPPSPADWARDIACVQFALHIAACLFFYAAVIKKHLSRFTAALAAGLLIAYPPLVTAATTPLADIFCTDLIMLAAALHSLGRAAQGKRGFLFFALCGLLL